MSRATLRGKAILVTRPRAQNSELIAAIEERGGSAITFPVIEIKARESHRVAQALEKLPKPDLAIFVSRNAVTFGSAMVDAPTIAAIGPSTSAALAAAGKPANVCPTDGYDSETLLREPRLQDVAGQCVWIVRGSAGRELLCNTLRDRGAEVHYLSVYERDVAAVDPRTAANLEASWQDGQIDAAIAMSVASLHNLIALLPPDCSSLLAERPLVTPAARVIKELLIHYPDATPVLAKGPTVDAMIEAIESAVPSKRTEA